MAPANPPLPLGTSPVLPGQLANVVTCLEMRQRPEPRARGGFPPTHRLERLDRPDVDSYRVLFRGIGENWLWYSRLLMPDDALRGILHDPNVEIFALREDGAEIGLLELDFRQAGECEIAFFGLVPRAIGTGLGRVLMGRAIELAWARPIERLWVHTCHFDHPAALAFYIRSGFRPYAIQVDIQTDPRLTGHLPRGAAPHVPLIDVEGR